MPLALTSGRLSPPLRSEVPDRLDALPRTLLGLSGRRHKGQDDRIDAGSVVAFKPSPAVLDIAVQDQVSHDLFGHQLNSLAAASPAPGSQHGSQEISPPQPAVPPLV